MAVGVRWATTGDAAALAVMLCEMALHYRQPPLDHDRALSVAQKWLGDESPAYPHFALARRGAEIVGMASVAIAHPGLDLKRLMFLKDLFVRDGFRANGAGLALVRFLAGYCLDNRIGRIDFTTEDWNEGAIRFYERLGAVRHGQKVFLRFDELSRLA